ncbi:MAG: glycine cleavage system protein H [Verrucomicrobiales bacterium]|nr:glycine cleavage system protein H [Verrucomicrobiales bacterium]|tara:strand:+ start:55 stop:435 length:381 start_codon:yes stop_codon:yes gene_type:complete
MSRIPENLKYATSHEWLSVEAETGTVGITDHAQEELTDIVFVELPEVGRQLEAGGNCAVVESVKSASEIYSPADGEVLEVNPALTDNPGLVNDDPYGDGWFFKMKISAPSESLLDAAGYASEIGES